MSQALVSARVVLEYRLLRAFIVQFITNSRKVEDKDEAILANMASEARMHALLSVGLVATVKKACVNGLSRVIAAQIDVLGVIDEHISIAVQTLYDSQGSNVLGNAPNLAQAWSKYGTAPDVDSAKLLAAQIHRFDVMALSQCMEPIKALIGKILARLQELAGASPDDGDQTKMEVD